MILSIVLLGSVNLTLGECSQLTKENKEKALKEICPNINDCELDEDAKKKLEEYKKKMQQSN